MSTGDKTLSFLYPANLSKEIKEEGYIRNKTDEFVIKSISTQGCWKTITAKLNVEDLEGKVFELFDTTNETITNCINLALAGTGWIVGTCNVTKRRTVRKTNSSSWDIIQEAKKVYRCELEFDTLNKKVNIYEKRGSDKGVYFLDSLNLKNLSIQGDSYDFYTRIIAKGKDDLKVTLENFQYSNKVKTYIWKDERYTDIDNLTEDAEAKLDELSKPYRAYSATIIDLANISKAEYKDILSYGLGDVITLVSKENGIKEKQRIVKLVEYPDEPSRNTCEIANTTLSFEDIQKEFQDTTDTVNNITTDNGTVDGSTINGISTEQIYDFEASVGKITDLTIVNARIDQLYAEKVNISELNAVIANVAELNSTKANITDLNTINANIEKLIAADVTINNALIGKADITELNTVKGTLTSLDSKIANIETLVNGNLSSENIQAGGITSDKLTIANGFITNAMIANLDVSKINAGDISTNKFRIVSDSGKMLISDNTIQISDKNRVRVQIGKDASNDYNMYVWDSAGKLMFDATGLKADGIKNKIIRDDMISDNANIDGAKLNISSLITEINKDTNTSAIKSTKVQIDSLKQTLDVAFTSLKTQADNTKSLTESHSTTIGVMQGQITTAINNTQIVKDGQTILLKDDYNRTVSLVNSINSTIGTHTTKIDELSGNITSVDTKVNSVQRDLEGTKSIVSSHTSQINGLNSTLSTQGASISQLQTQIALKVEQTDITTAINKMNIGVRNLAQKTSKEYTTPFSSFNGGTNKTAYVANVLTDGLKVGDTVTVRLLYKYTDIVAASGKTAQCWLQGSGNVTEWSGGGFNSSSKLTLSGSGEYEFLYSFTINTNHLKNSSWSVSIRHDYVQSGSVQWKMFKVEKGTKATDWTPAPEDVDSSIANVQKQVTTTNNKVTTIETNLNSITQRVASTESTISTHTTQLGTVDSRINTAKSSAISTASSDATTKANTAQTNAINSAKSYTDGQITTVNKTITNKVSEIKSTTDSISQRVSSTESKVSTINGNVTNLTNRVSTAESKLTATSLTTTISSAISGGTSSISTTQFVMDKNGLTIKNGALTIKNKSGTTVFNSDTNGNLIVTGTLKSQSGAQFVSMSSGGIDFQDWNKNEQMLRIGISYFDSNRDMNGVTFALARYGDFIRFSHVAKADLTNGWTSSDTQYNFFDCWSSDQTVGGISYKKGINVYAPMYINNGLKLYSGTTHLSEISGAVSWNNGKGTVNNLLGLYGDNGTVLGYKSGESLQARLIVTEASHPGTGDNIISWGNYNFNGYTFHNANIVAKSLSVSGSKNCLQETKNYGSRLINAYETAEYYFGDLGFGKIDSDGECLAYIDDIFLECVNTKVAYHVFTQIYNGKITSIERYTTYVVIKGEPGTNFSWQLMGKRKGYENNRLDTEEIENQDGNKPELFSDGDFKVETSENDLMDLLTFNLEDLLMEG